MDNIETVKLNPKSIDNLIKKLTVATGIKFEYYQKPFLEKRIKFRMNNLNLNSCKSYLEYINKHPEEIDLFQENFTINHTFFFRNYEIFEKVGNLVKDFAMGLKNPIKIWSCPCASGEEPYSIALFFDQLKKKRPNFPDYEIVASDIDKRAIELARRGIYRNSIIKEVPNIYKTSYFKKEKENNSFIYIINDNIKDKVEFIIEDLTKGHEKPHKYDIIFCRNFLIYINENYRKRVTQILENHLKDKGLLILGKTETLSEGHSNFKSYDPKNNFYVKEDFDLKKRSGAEIEQRKKSPSKKLEDKGKQYKKTTKPVKKITSHPKQVKSQKKKISPLKTQKEQIKAELKPLKTYIKGSAKQVKPSKIQSRPSEIIKRLRFKDVEELFKKIEQRFKQIELLEKQTDLLEKQVNRRLEQVELLKKQIILRENELEEPEKQIELREKQIEHSEMLLEQRKKNIKQRGIRAEQRIKQLALLERDVEQRIKQLEQLEKQVEKRVEERVKYLEQLEKQVKKRIDDQIKQHAEPLKKKVKKIVKQDVQLTDQIKEGDLIQVTNPNIRGELVIPEGYYALINYNEEKLTSYKFSIFRLGSGIALILKDDINKIYIMSHCILPNSAETEQIEKLYKIIKISVNELLSILLSNGASKENVKGFILGGAKTFNEDSTFIQKNIKMFKRELNSLEIQIEREDIGGLSERTIIYDTKNNSLLVKKTWERNMRILK